MSDKDDAVPHNLIYLLKYVQRCLYSANLKAGKKVVKHGGDKLAKPPQIIKQRILLKGGSDLNPMDKRFSSVNINLG